MITNVLVKSFKCQNNCFATIFFKLFICDKFQALANQESLDSKISKPLVVLWPGIITPDIDEVMTTTGNAIKIAWNRPFSSKNVQILGYWVSKRR